ncbi:MAG TPA: WD40 repeat domain-containing protein [Gemmataceae bacterium]
MSFRTRLPLLILFWLCSVSRAEPQLDRFGDPLPEGAIVRLGNLDLRNDIPILTAAFTADGKTFVTGDAVSIAFWDLATGKCVRRVPLKNAGPVQLRRLSNDGKILMLSDSHDIIHFLDAFSGEEQRTLNHARCGPIWGKTLELARDGKILAAVHRASNATAMASIAVWEVAGSKLLHEFKVPSLAQGPPPYDLIALTPDGKQLVLPHDDGSLHLVDIANGKEVRAFEMPPSRQRVAPASRVAPAFRFQRLVLSPDGRYLAFGGSAATWTVCDMTTGKRVRQLESLQSYVSGPIFTPNGRFIAVDENKEVRLFGVLSGKEIRKLPKPGQVGPSTKLVFSPDGRMLAAFPSSHTIYIWDVVAQRRLHPLVGHEGQVRALAFFPDGKRLVSADQTGERRVWDIASGQSLAQRTYNYGAQSLTVDGDGETVRFACNDISVHQWDLRTGREEVRKIVGDGLYSNVLALSPDGRSLAVLVPNRAAPQKARGAPELRLYDLKTNQSIVLPRPTEQGGFGYLAFTPDSHCLAASCGGVLRLWDRDTGKLVREVQRVTLDGSPVHLALAADGRSFIALMDRMLRIREIASGEDRLQTHPLGNMFSLAYSPDARCFACGLGDGQILVFSAVSGIQLAQWQGKQGYVFSLAFSRDGRFLASGGTNGTILIWKVPQEEELLAVLSAKETDSLWQALGDRDAAVANRALVGFAAAPAKTLPYFKDRLSSLGKQLDSSQIADLIAKLDDDSFKVREQAMSELARAGANAADALGQALHKNPSAEAKRRIEDLLARLKKGGDSQRLRFVRAVEALERIGTTQAKEMLRNLAGQSLPPDLREEVQGSLSRLGDKP